MKQADGTFVRRRSQWSSSSSYGDGGDNLSAEDREALHRQLEAERRRQGGGGGGGGGGAQGGGHGTNSTGTFVCSSRGSP